MVDDFKSHTFYTGDSIDRKKQARNVLRDNAWNIPKNQRLEQKTNLSLQLV